MVCAFGILCLLFFSACSPCDRQKVDELNDVSYAYHYINLDTTVHYARLALDLTTDGYESGRAEALNNIAFAAMSRMDYKNARNCLNEAVDISDNQIEKLVSYVQQMRLCQRMSLNKEYYEVREKAVKRMERINEERDKLSERHYKRLVYAETEFAIINSTYYYYVGLEEQSADALLQIDPHGPIVNDKAQYTNYLYNIGSGGILKENTVEETQRKEWDFLQHSLSEARENGYIYFEANSMMAMADLGGSIDLAGNALMLFEKYGDVYQTSAANRTLAECLCREGNTEEAFAHLGKSLSDTLVYQAPDLVASIYRQMAMTYLASEDTLKYQQYYTAAEEIQNETRRDRYYEARMGMLDESLQVLDALIVSVIIAILILLIALRFFYRMSLKDNDAKHSNVLLEPLRHWQDVNRLQLELQQEHKEEIEESTAIAENNLVREGRTLVEHKSRLALVNSMLPFVDRILNEVEIVANRSQEDEEITRQRYEYICALSEKINEYNEVLTEWIKMSQGSLMLKIESFSLSDIFDIIERSKSLLAVKGIDLDVRPTDYVVKADKVLTLFMVNTIVENARKNTAEGGEVKVYADEVDGCVEISVEDNGCGMSEEKLSNIFSRTAYEGKGFGLINCRGIMEKYRKTSRLFDKCLISAKSAPGGGSRFFFRLPKGIKGKIIAMLMLILSFNVVCATDSLNLNKDYYQIDIEKFEELSYSNDLVADSTLAEYCRVMQQAESDRIIAVGILAFLFILILPAYYILYYRHRLFYKFCVGRVNSMNKILLEDLPIKEKLEKISPLAHDEYPEPLEKVVCNVVMTLREAEKRYDLEQTSIDFAEDELKKVQQEGNALHVSNLILDNCFSTLKHETMYYPNRIIKMAENKQTNLQDLKETVNYYRELCFMFTAQARQQLEYIKVAVKTININKFLSLDDDIYVIANEEMLDYMFEILKKQIDAECEWTAEAIIKDADYVVLSVPTSVKDNSIFFPKKENIPYLICRQIVREHAEVTNRFGCGIVVKQQEKKNIIEITLPRSRYGQV